jgi:AbrB family looped-hinge helix DNA binding protein
MAQARITSKGQVTIPKSIRERLHLHPGDKVDLLVSENGDAILRPITKTTEEIFGLLASSNRKSLSVKKMNNRLRQSFRKKYEA